jgi:uncharacterized repeat protein (TIGR03803 family)
MRSILLAHAKLGKLTAWKRHSAVLSLCAAAAIASHAQTVATLVNFNGTNGSFPYAALIQGADGNLYGTTVEGGANLCLGNLGYAGCGTIFRVSLEGNFTTLHSFDGTDGKSPEVALVQASKGSFYGATSVGGTNFWNSTISKMSPAGTLATLHTFGIGEGPGSALIQLANGDLYGTTYYGGPKAFGSIFKMTPRGTLTTVHNFTGHDGASPGRSPLVQARNGDL